MNPYQPLEALNVLFLLLFGSLNMESPDPQTVAASPVSSSLPPAFNVAFSLDADRFLAERSLFSLSKGAVY